MAEWPLAVAAITLLVAGVAVVAWRRATWPAGTRPARPRVPRAVSTVRSEALAER
jgi:hypothetical protein